MTSSDTSYRLGGLASRINNKIRALAKRSYLTVRYSRDAPKAIGLIMGVQRSGTGALVRAFENDWNCRTFGEDGGLALGANAGAHMRWRWKPYNEVAQILSRERAPLLIAKPLVESQNAAAILACVPEGKIIWAFRDYRDVALSGQKRFGSETIKFHLRSILEGREHWYSENADEEMRRLVSNFCSDERPIYDLRALGWYVRNSLVFRYENLPIKFSNYDDFVTNPERVMRRLYDFLGRPYPGNYILRHVHPKSVKLGRDLGISRDICQLCEGMLQRLVERSSET